MEMNERIKELIHKSTVPADKVEDYAKSEGLIVPDEKLDVEKFAELIVEECANVLLKWKNEPFPFDEDVAVSLIREHFGIKNNGG